MKNHHLVKNIKIQRSILLVFLFAALTILLFVKLISINTADTRNTDFLVNNTYEIIKRVEKIKSGVAESESSVRAWVATGDKRWQASLDETQQQITDLLQQTRGLLTDAQQKNRLNELEQVIHRKITFQQSIISPDLKPAQLSQKINYDGEDRIIALRIKIVLAQFMDRQHLLLQQHLAASSEAKSKALPIVIMGSILIFIFITATLIQLNRDVTRRKNAEEEIRERESKYRQLIEEAGVTMFTANTSGTFTYVSSRCHSLTGYTVSELTGQNFSLLVLPDWIENVIAKYMDQVRTQQRESTIEFPIFTKEGNLKWVEQHAVLQFNEASAITGYQCVVKDITERKYSERLLKNADQKIRAMLSSTQEGFYMISPEYTIIMINEAAQDAMKLVSGRNCVLGDSMLDFIQPDHSDSFKQLFARVTKGNNEETETCLQTQQGEKWYQTSYFPVWDEHDRVIAVCASSKDVTERKRVEKALDKTRAEREEYQFRLQSILDNSPAIVFVKDLQGRYLIINKSFREMHCLTDDEVIGKTDFDFDKPEQATRYKETDDEVISTLRSIESEEKFHSQHNGIQNLLLVKFPLFDKNNTVYGVGGIATDFTDNVQYRQKLIAAKKKAESAEQLQEQFLANMSHEIRTPMNGITGMTNILMSTPLDDQQKEFVKIIKQSSDSLLFLINDILDLSKIKAGKLSLEHTSFNLHEMIDTTLAPFQLKAKEKNIELLLVQDSQLPSMIEGDPYRLNQILNNLLSNAMKFTEQGSVKLVVKQVQQSKDKVMLEFAISDTGVGIPADKLESIFNSFEQANVSTARLFGGTGLGLAITKKLVEMQDGTIDVESVVDGGTTFRFAIGYDIAKKENLTTANAVKETTNANELAGKKILVVEDNEINQKVIFHVMQKEGLKVTLANNGREAVTLLEQGNDFDLIIMDLQMPVMDGFQATTYIRKKLQIQVPIIAMTASVLRNEKIKCFELGFNEYLTKPFVPVELFAQLRRFLFAQPYTEAATTSQPAQPSASLYNLSYLREMDDNEGLCEILQLFLDTTPVTLNELSNEVLHENWEMVGKLAHKLKSSLAVLQMSGMLELITTIEQQGKNKVDTAKIEEEFKQVTEQFELIRPMIEGELREALLKRA